jgi:hypothetical protein
MAIIKETAEPDRYNGMQTQTTGAYTLSFNLFILC